MKQEHRIVMLPTTDTEFPLILDESESRLRGMLHFNGGQNKDKWNWELVQKMHLYVLSDEVIKKKGDYYIGIKDIGGTPEVLQCEKDGEYLAKKIIVTTDKALTKLIAGGGKGNAGMWKFIPQLKQNFIEEYCKRGGVDKVVVEYEMFDNANFNRAKGVSSANPTYLLKLKADQDNTANLSFCKDSWTEEDIREFTKWVDRQPRLMNPRRIGDLFKEWKNL